MIAFLYLLKEKYGGPVNYVKTFVGLTEDDISVIRNNLIVRLEAWWKVPVWRKLDVFFNPGQFEDSEKENRLSIIIFRAFARLSWLVRWTWTMKVSKSL